MDDTVLLSPKDRPQVIGIDSLWFDPFLLNVACPIQLLDVAITAGAPRKLLPADPRRWLVGFAVNSSSTLPQIGPWPDANLFSLNTSSSGQPVMIFTLTTLGPWVGNSWYANSPGATTVRCFTCSRI